MGRTPYILYSLAVDANVKRHWTFASLVIYYNLYENAKVVPLRADAIVQIVLKESHAMKDHASREGGACIIAFQAMTYRESLCFCNNVRLGEGEI